MKVLATRAVERLCPNLKFSLVIEPYRYDGVISSVTAWQLVDLRLVRYIQRLSP